MPKRPSSTPVGPSPPSEASRAASSEPCAAQAGWNGFVAVASSRYANRPPANEPAIPSAEAVVAASAPIKRADAAVPPKIPQIAVGWNPRAWNSPEAAAPTRVTISFPTTIAGSSSAPDEPWASAVASAAGQTTTLTCETESECVSSKSRPWQIIPFAKAAFGAGSALSSPITDDCPSPPSSAIAVLPSVATPSAEAA